MQGERHLRGQGWGALIAGHRHADLQAVLSLVQPLQSCLQATWLTGEGLGGQVVAQ